MDSDMSMPGGSRASAHPTDTITIENGVLQGVLKLLCVINPCEIVRALNSVGSANSNLPVTTTMVTTTTDTTSTISPTPSQSDSSVPQTSHNDNEVRTDDLLRNRSGRQTSLIKGFEGRMLIIFESGVQRLITFILRPESCTWLHLLQGCGVEIDNTSVIRCFEYTGDNIDFVVTIGEMPKFVTEAIAKSEQTKNLSDGMSSTAANSVNKPSDNKYPYEVLTQRVLKNRSDLQLKGKNPKVAKMLVIYGSGTQRLITFTLPEVVCTVQEVLEESGVVFDDTTSMQCFERAGDEFDFLVLLKSGKDQESKLQTSNK